MRVGINGTVFKKPVTGVAKRLVELVRHVEHLADDVEFVLFTPRRMEVGELAHLTQIRSPIRFERPWLRHVLPAHLRRLKIDILDAPWGGGLPTHAGGKACAFVTTLHDTIPLDRTDLRGSRPARAYRAHVARNLAVADRVVVVSEHTRSRLLAEFELAAEKVFLSYNGVADRFHPLEPGETGPADAVRGPYVLYVGGFNARKNVERLVEAFARIAGAFPDHALVLAGACNRYFRSRIEPLLARRGVRDRARLPGYVPEAQLPALYRGADLLIYPSLYEGFGMPPAEALACGCRVLAHRGSALPEVVGDAATLVDMRDVDAIARAAASLLSSRPDGETARRHAAAIRARFSWDRTARDYLALYRSLAG